MGRARARCPRSRALPGGPGRWRCGQAERSRRARPRPGRAAEREAEAGPWLSRRESLGITSLASPHGRTPTSPSSGYPAGRGVRGRLGTAGRWGVAGQGSLVEETLRGRSAPLFPAPPALGALPSARSLACRGPRRSAPVRSPRRQEAAGRARLAPGRMERNTLHAPSWGGRSDAGALPATGRISSLCLAAGNWSGRLRARSRSLGSFPFAASPGALGAPRAVPGEEGARGS